MGLGQLGEEIPDEGEQTRIGGRIGAGGAADGLLVDIDYLVQVGGGRQSFDMFVLTGFQQGAVQFFSGQGWVRIW